MASKVPIKIFIDTNILLDFLLGRPRAVIAKARLKNADIYVTPLTIATAYYVAARQSDFAATNFYEAVAALKIAPVDGFTMQQAYILTRVGERDLEDAIQVAACQQAKIAIFITADKQLARQYKQQLAIECIE